MSAFQKRSHFQYWSNVKKWKLLTPSLWGLRTNSKEVRLQRYHKRTIVEEVKNIGQVLYENLFKCFEWVLNISFGFGWEARLWNMNSLQHNFEFRYFLYSFQEYWKTVWRLWKMRNSTHASHERNAFFSKHTRNIFSTTLTEFINSFHPSSVLSFWLRSIHKKTFHFLVGGN